MAFLQLFFLKTHPEVAVVQQTTHCTAECQCLESHWTKAPRGVIHTKKRKIKIWESDPQEPWFYKSASCSGQSPQTPCHPADVWTESFGHPVWSTRQIVITNSDWSPGTNCECASGSSVFEISKDDSSPTLTPLYVIWHGTEPPLLHPVTLGQLLERKTLTLQSWAGNTTGKESNTER